jgi:hypothetical protein
VLGGHVRGREGLRGVYFCVAAADGGYLLGELGAEGCEGFGEVLAFGRVGLEVQLWGLSVV